MLSQNKVTYLAGCHETSTACPLDLAEKRKQEEDFTKDPKLMEKALIMKV